MSLWRFSAIVRLLQHNIAFKHHPLFHEFWLSLPFCFLCFCFSSSEITDSSSKCMFSIIYEIKNIIKYKTDAAPLVWALCVGVNRPYCRLIGFRFISFSHIFFFYFFSFFVNAFFMWNTKGHCYKMKEKNTILSLIQTHRCLERNKKIWNIAVWCEMWNEKEVNSAQSLCDCKSWNENWKCRFSISESCTLKMKTKKKKKYIDIFDRLNEKNKETKSQRINIIVSTNIQMH